MSRKAVFVDRDGTLIEEVNFLSRTEDLKLFPFTSQAIDLLKANGYLVIVVSNQSGVGRGLFEESAVYDIHEHMQFELGGKLDGLYFCPHLPDSGCECRKPNLGLINAAVSDLDLEIQGSWIIGDKKLDMETGFNAGLSTAMVKTGYGTAHSDELSRKPDVIADNILEAARIVVANSNGRAAD